MHKCALLLVDLQNDFCAGGSLAVPDGDSTIAIANEMIAHCKVRGALIVATQDWHLANHGSFASVQGTEPYTLGELDGYPQIWWPDHCVQNTPGAELHPLLNSKEVDAVFHKGENLLIDSYSAFYDNGHRQKTELDAWLSARGIAELIVLGLATDYCVKFTVLDALELGYKVTVITDGCRGVNINSQDSLMAFQDMSAAGATLTTLVDFSCQ